MLVESLLHARPSSKCRGRKDEQNRPKRRPGGLLHCLQESRKQNGEGQGTLGGDGCYGEAQRACSGPGGQGRPLRRQG